MIKQDHSAARVGCAVDQVQVGGEREKSSSGVM